MIQLILEHFFGPQASSGCGGELKVILNDWALLRRNTGTNPDMERVGSETPARVINTDKMTAEEFP